jgi:hypothetical protein
MRTPTSASTVRIGYLGPTPRTAYRYHLHGRQRHRRVWGYGAFGVVVRLQHQLGWSTSFNMARQKCRGTGCCVCATGQ